MLNQSPFTFRTAFHYVKLQDILLGRPWTPVMSLPWNCGLRACYTASANELTFLVSICHKKLGLLFLWKSLSIALREESGDRNLLSKEM